MEENIRKRNIRIFIIIFIILLFIIISAGNKVTKNIDIEKTNKINEFRIISSSENEDLENILLNYAKQNDINLTIDYAGTIDIMDRLNSGEEYDAVWTSNSIWLYMLNSNVKVKNSKSTSINPVVFGIKKSKAQELGFIGKDVYMKDILGAIQNGKLKFNMSSATQTNTGATAYLGFLTTLAGNPEILKEEDLQNETLKENVKDIFSGVTRSSGSDEFLEEMFLNGDYEAVVTYETSIININKKLEKNGKEPLYIVYAKDRSFYF
ncbi:MAG: substrate-binding domain-containing protein [Clostridia bacterium]|nr:substrate-binding domain-containing protein [Clostridia bacterium]